MVVQRGEVMREKTDAVVVAVTVAVASAVAVAVAERRRRRQHGRSWPALLLLLDTMKRRR